MPGYGYTPGYISLTHTMTQTPRAGAGICWLWVWVWLGFTRAFVLLSPMPIMDQDAVMGWEDKPWIPL